MPKDPSFRGYEYPWGIPDTTFSLNELAFGSSGELYSTIVAMEQDVPAEESAIRATLQQLRAECERGWTESHTSVMTQEYGAVAPETRLSGSTGFCPNAHASGSSNVEHCTRARSQDHIFTGESEHQALFSQLYIENGEPAIYRTTNQPNNSLVTMEEHLTAGGSRVNSSIFDLDEHSFGSSEDIYNTILAMQQHVPPSEVGLLTALAQIRRECEGQAFPLNAHHIEDTSLTMQSQVNAAETGTLAVAERIHEEGGNSTIGQAFRDMGLTGGPVSHGAPDLDAEASASIESANPRTRTKRKLYKHKNASGLEGVQLAGEYKHWFITTFGTQLPPQFQSCLAANSHILKRLSTKRTLPCPRGCIDPRTRFSTLIDLRKHLVRCHLAQVTEAQAEVDQVFASDDYPWLCKWTAPCGHRCLHPATSSELHFRHVMNHALVEMGER